MSLGLEEVSSYSLGTKFAVFCQDSHVSICVWEEKVGKTCSCELES